MPNAYKIAAQSAPAANTDTTIYTAPALTSFVESTLTICNRNAAGVAATYRIAVVPAAASLAIQHYLVYDAMLDGRGTRTLNLGFTLGAADKVIVRSSSADLSFSMFGCEIS